MTINSKLMIRVCSSSSSVFVNFASEDSESRNSSKYGGPIEEVFRKFTCLRTKLYAPKIYISHVPKNIYMSAKTFI